MGSSRTARRNGRIINWAGGSEAVMLFLRRHSAWIPQRVRAGMRARVGFRPADQDAPIIDGWTRPLVVDVPVHIASGLTWGALVATEPRPEAGAEDFAVSATTPSVPGQRRRVALLTGPLSRGGMSGVVALLARGLHARGVSVAVTVVDTHMARDPLGASGAQLAAVGILVEALDDAKTLGAWFDRWGADLVSAHGAPDWAVETAALRGLPVVETLHGSHTLFGVPQHELLRRSEWLAGVVAVSDLVSRQFVERCGAVAPNVVVTIPNGTLGHGFDPGLRSRARAALGLRDEFVWASLARLSLQKNAYGLVAAYSLVDARESSHLILAGDTDDAGYAAQVQRLRRTDDALGRVHLRTGTRADLLLAAADGFVLNSFFEGWSLASMEAMTAGLPVVLSDVAGAREQLAAPVPVGVLVDNPLRDPGDVDWRVVERGRFARQRNREQVAAAMTGIMAQRDEWSRRRPDLAAQASSRFALGGFVDQYQAAFEAVLGNGYLKGRDSSAVERAAL